MSHEPRDEQVLSVQRLQRRVEVSGDERVGVVLHHHLLTVTGRHPVDDRAAVPTDVVQRARAVVVLNVDDRDPGRSGAIQQRRRLKRARKSRNAS